MWTLSFRSFYVNYLNCQENIFGHVKRVFSFGFRFKFCWEKLRLVIYFLKNFELIFIQFKTLFERYQIASLDSKVFVFVKKFEICLFSMNLKAQKKKYFFFEFLWTFQKLKNFGLNTCWDISGSPSRLDTKKLSKTQIFKLSKMIIKCIKIIFRIQRSLLKSFLVFWGPISAKISFWKKTSQNLPNFTQKWQKSRIFQISIVVWGRKMADIRPKNLSKVPA